MNRWPEIRVAYSTWLRTFPLLTRIGQPGDSPEIIGNTDEPVCLEVEFWSERTHEVETLALQHITDTEIDVIFAEVAAVIDEDLHRFAPHSIYYQRFGLLNYDDQIEWEREAAHSVKRDLAWAAIEQVIGLRGFFNRLIPWYERGRWPIGWSGQYPDGHVRVV